MADKAKASTLKVVLVVVAVIGIIAAVAVPVVLNHQQQERDTAQAEATAQQALLTRTQIETGLKTDLKNAATQVETWLTDNPAGTPTASALTGGFSTGTTVKITNTVTADGYCLFASNPGATTATGKVFQAYNSIQGGLQPGTTDSTVCLAKNVEPEPQPQPALTQLALDASLKSDLKNAATLAEVWITDNPGRVVPADALTDGRFTPGTTVKLTAGANVGDYCLFASNPGATEATGKAFLAYRSALGGLQPGTTTSTACPK